MPQIALTSDGALPRRSKRARPSAPSPSVLLRYLLVSFFGFLAVSAAADVAEIIAFDLLPVTDLRAGLFEVSLGPENGGNVQKVALLAGFATNTGAMMELPVASLCTPGSTGNWNVISFPSTGNVVVVGGNQTDSTLVPIKWSPTVSSFKTDTFVGLVLRKGKGNQAKNVSTISTSTINNGQYDWDVSETFYRQNLKNGGDYSLMLWTTGRSSISGYFTLRTTSTIAADKDDNNSGSNATNEMSAADLSTQKACLGLLAADGGYYNETLDSTFRFADYYTDSFKNTNTHWEITNTGSGYGTLSFESWNASRSQTTSRFTDTTINLISKSTLGKGLFSLSWLQSARNAETADMNVVSLNLGIKGSPGSVVMGGYDAALIDFNNKAVFSKGTELPFAYYASMIRLNVNSGGVDINVLEDETKTIVDKVPNVGLTYDDFGIRLAQETIDKILPLVGNPVYDAGVNGYVYSGVPNTDWSFIFFLTNHTDPISIQIPASTLLATDSSTNDPLSSHNETGKTYLQLSPTADGSSNGQYLGRTFLQHAYLIDSNAPSTIGKFHLSALPTPLPVGKSLVAASLQSIHIFDSETEAIVPSKAPRAGPMVGGIVGGAFLLASTVFVSYWCIRRRKMRLKNSINTADLAKASLEKEIKLRHIVNLHHGGGGPARGVDNFSAGASSYRTTASIPIHYSPSLTRDV